LGGFMVSSIGIAIWSLFLSGFAAPWSIFPMIVALWAYWKFFSGSWGPRKSVETRKYYFRRRKLSPLVWKWGLGCAILFVIVVQASFIITFRIIEFPAGRFTTSVPLWFRVCRS
jgi:hypothetical protein